MSTVESLNECKQCGKESSYESYNVRTGENSSFCMNCGKSYSFNMKREAGKVVYDSNVYSRDELYLATLKIDEETGIVQSFELKPVLNRDVREISTHFCYISNTEKLSVAVKNKEKEDEIILLYGDFYEVEDNKIENKFIVWEEEIKEGKGVIKIEDENGSVLYPVNSLTDEQFVAYSELAAKTNGSVSKWDKVNNTVVFDFGKNEESYCDDFNSNCDCTDSECKIYKASKHNK